MDSSQIEQKLKDLTSQINHESFLFDLLTIYDFPKATITRLKKGDANLSKKENEYLLKNKVLFKAVDDSDPHYVIDEFSVDESTLKHRPRFIIVTNFETFLAQDTKTKDSLDIQIDSLSEHYDFFFPWIGREKSKIQNEAAADIKAANKMAQLYDLLIQTNPTFNEDENKKHALNLFFARLLFCYFAEDTELFEEHLFSSTFEINSNEDGSNAHEILSQIFHSLDDKDKNNYPSFCKKFPFVGGDLFQEKIEVPLISRNARSMILDAGKLDWYVINPDIFGSMIQVIASSVERSNFGAHYTSVVNILKVINPLFMDSLNEQFDKCESEKDYENLLKRIYSLKIFDPASGSGNFLIVTYKELCQLEFRIFRALQHINPSKWILASLGVRSSQFFALTIKDFDGQIAKLSMYITEHQMHQELNEIYGDVKPTLPFENKLNIRIANSLHEDWKSFLHAEDDEIYIIGNPPYVGSSKQNNEQKNDLQMILKNYSNYKNLDYVACWFHLGSLFIAQTARTQLAFVTTDSITQGEQVNLLWPNIDSNDVGINFAYESFKWKNNAQHNAGVNCCILGLGKKNNKLKFIYDKKGIKTIAKNINPYLIDDDFVAIKRLSKPLSNIPEMRMGNKPTDNGNLILDDQEYKELLNNFPESRILLKKFIGSEELVKRTNRWCLWIADEQIDLAMSIPPIKERIEKVRESRLESDAQSTKEKANIPHRFIQIQSEPTEALVIAGVTSMNRSYIPVTFITDDTVCSNKIQVIYDAPVYLFALLVSNLHNLWIKAIGGKRGETTVQNSSLCYNSFVVPDISEDDKNILSKMSFAIMDVREKYPDQTFAQLYDPKKMPNDLKQVHIENDKLVDKIVLGKNDLRDKERLSMLFKMYREMEKNNAKSSRSKL